jgi:hypothetical protein
VSEHQSHVEHYIANPGTPLLQSFLSTGGTPSASHPQRDELIMPADDFGISKEPYAVIAGPRVRAVRGPRTGSAQQSQAVGGSAVEIAWSPAAPRNDTFSSGWFLLLSSKSLALWSVFGSFSPVRDDNDSDKAPASARSQRKARGPADCWPRPGDMLPERRFPWPKRLRRR